MISAPTALAMALMAPLCAADDTTFEALPDEPNPQLRELSGLARSDTWPGVFWAIQDSADDPWSAAADRRVALLAYDADGRLIVPHWQRHRYPGATGASGEEADGNARWPGHRLAPATNVDWEDVAVADGRIYIADLGNNGNARRDLGIYVVNEFDPRQRDRARVLCHLPVRYADQSFPCTDWRFDAEALFIDAGGLFVLTKHRRASEIDGFIAGTRLYRLDLAGARDDADNELRPIGSGHAGLLCPTAAALSPDRAVLAVMTFDRLWLFARPDQGDDWLASASHSIEIPRDSTGATRFAGGGTQGAEALAFEDALHLRVMLENGTRFRITLDPALLHF